MQGEVVVTVRNWEQVPRHLKWRKPTEHAIGVVSLWVPRARHKPLAKEVSTEHALGVGRWAP